MDTFLLTLYRIFGILRLIYNLICCLILNPLIYTKKRELSFASI